MIGAIRSLYRNVYDDRTARHFLVTMLLFGTAGGLFSGVLNNYLHDILHITRLERGVVEFPRELPGLLLVAFSALLYRYSEKKIVTVALVAAILGTVGLVLAGRFRLPGILLIVFWSTGEHLMMPVRSSIAVHMAHAGKEGLALGGTGSVGNIGQLAGYYLVPLVFLVVPFIAPGVGSLLSFRVSFALAAVVLGIALFAVRGIESRGHIRRERLYFRRRYLRYYLLEVFFDRVAGIAEHRMNVDFGPARAEAA